MSSQRHLLVLGDQLTRSVGPLASADPDSTSILMIESIVLADSTPHHKQKLVLVFSAMRHFAESLRQQGFRVSYHQADSFEAGMATYIKAKSPPEIEVMEPADWGYEHRLRVAAEDGGARLRVLPNELWLTNDEEFDTWAAGRKALPLRLYGGLRLARHP